MQKFANSFDAVAAIAAVADKPNMHTDKEK